MSDLPQPRGGICTCGEGNACSAEPCHGTPRPDVFEKMRRVSERLTAIAEANAGELWTIERLRAVLATIKDADVTYGIILDADAGSCTPMMVERDAIVDALYGEDDPLEGANCGLCGATADNFYVSDDLWERVGLGQVQACFKCFRIAACHAGVRTDPGWQVSL